MLKVYKQCLWKTKPGTVFWPFSFITKDVKETKNYDDCDVCITGDFLTTDPNPKTYRNDILHIHWTIENFKRPGYKHWELDYKKPKKHLLVGVHNPTKDSCFFPPWLNNRYKLDRIDYSKRNDNDFENRYYHWLCSMFNVKYEHRQKIIKHYNAKEINTPFIKNPHGYKFPRDDEKEKIIKDYLLNIAVENSKDSTGHYITEKIVNSIVADCIPIYWGGNLKYTPFNQDRIFNILNDDFYPNINLDKSLLRDMYYLPSLNNNYKEMRDELLDKCKKMILDLL